ncbi:MAG: HU family DNA-binding protein [bacterium]|nr:HU family DNA-binding protein [Myxococcales bacterium]MCB9548847.1 HU family DNA-binding protein [Myxococcales bacterium]
MTKAELIEAVHAAAGEGMTRKAVADLVDTIFDRIASSVREDGKFYMPGFGTWTLKERQARTGRNPRTGDALEIPASRTVGFKVSSELKAEL